MSTLNYPDAADTLATSHGDYAILIMSDSTAANAAFTNWPELWAAQLAETYPAYTVLYSQWNGIALDYDPAVPVQTGTGPFTVHVWNGSEDGYLISDIITNRQKLIIDIGKVDQWVISMGQNLPQPVQADYQSLIDVCLTDQPFAYGNMMTMNPWLTNDPWIAGQVALVDTVADINNLGYLNIWEAFHDTGARLAEYMEDNVHPNQAGNVLWQEANWVYWCQNATIPASNPDPTIQLPRYTTVQAVKQAMGIDDDIYDARVELSIVAAEYNIDAWLGTSFPNDEILVVPEAVSKAALLASVKMTKLDDTATGSYGSDSFVGEFSLDDPFTALRSVHPLLMGLKKSWGVS